MHLKRLISRESYCKPCRLFFVSDRSWLARSCFVISLLVSSDDVWVVVLADFQGQRGAVPCIDSDEQLLIYIPFIEQLQLQ